MEESDIDSEEDTIFSTNNNIGEGNKEDMNGLILTGNDDDDGINTDTNTSNLNTEQSQREDEKVEGNDNELETATIFSTDIDDEKMNNEDTISPIIINNGPNVTPDNNDEENNNEYNISPIQINDGDDHENNTNA